METVSETSRPSRSAFILSMRSSDSERVLVREQKMTPRNVVFVQGGTTLLSAYWSGKPSSSAVAQKML